MRIRVDQDTMVSCDKCEWIGKFKNAKLQIASITYKQEAKIMLGYFHARCSYCNDIMFMLTSFLKDGK